ncbi:MAG: peptide MFS transporter [Leptospiraceae bacterium]|nr:peptide MFS transporter [Leptospiraceae bacterium]
MQKEKTNNNHHPGLKTLFFTEMWERFSYYGMRALMVLYLVKFQGFEDEKAGSVYGAYTSLVYLTPILGGYIADKYLGIRKAVYLGGILMMLGHLTLTFESIHFFYLGLVFLIFGNGFFKPNMSSLVGKLYEDRVWMKESAYTYYYMGINIGGSLGPLFCGYIGEVYGWHYGFGLAGIGMLIGLVQFSFGSRKLGDLGIEPESKIKNEIKKTKSILNKGELNRIYFLIILAFLSILFWIPYEQMGSSVNLYTDRVVDRKIFGFDIPASVFQSINGFLILAFAPITASLWNYFQSKDKEIGVPAKFLLGFIFLGVSFGFLGFGEIIRGSEKSSVLWLLIFYVFITIGELCISPVGLSTVSNLAPARFVGILMGIWFLSNAISHFFSGWLSGAYIRWMNIGEFFSSFVITSIIASLILLLINKKMKFLLKEGNE